jgi:integrase
MLDGTGEIELRRTVEDVDRHGNVRIYVRLPGGGKTRLRERPGSQAFIEEHRNAMLGKPAKAASQIAPAGKGTVRWLIQAYYACAEFKQLDMRTQRVRRLILEKLSDKHGDKRFAELESRHIRGWRDARTDTPEAANGIIKSLRQVFAFAIDNDIAKANPARDVPYLKAKGDGFHSWSLDEVRRFEDRHAIGSKARLALALLLYTAQRRSDVVEFGPAHVREGWLCFTQAKNRNRSPSYLEIPVRPDLQAIIDASQCGGDTFLVTEYGKPFTANGFGNWFRDRCDEAGLSNCTAHGLRKAAATRLADAGKSEYQIMAVTGHRTSKEVGRYTRAARQRHLAGQAFGAAAEQIIVPLSKPTATSGTLSPPTPLKTKEKRKKVVPRDGVEPPTRGFSIRCSTN